MNEMSIALVCPRDGLVGFVSDEGSVVLRDPQSAFRQRMSITHAIKRFPDCTLVEAESEPDAEQKLQVASDCSTTLDFALMLFDSELPISVRRNAAKELDLLIKNAVCRDYVLDIVLATPLPDQADIDGAKEAAQGYQRSQQLVIAITECAPRVVLAFRAWISTKSNRMIEPDHQQHVHSAFIRHGVFRRLVTEGTTQSDVESVVGSLAVQLHKHIDGRILREFANDYKSGLPKGAGRKKLEIPKSRSREDKSESTTTKLRSLPERERTRSDDLADWAAQQIDSIAEQYREGNDTNGDRYLDELVESQTQGVDDFRHVVKSLCNLSTKCSTVGREELCMGILAKAFKYKSGVDAKAFTLLADEFFRVKDLTKADECYVKASELETSSEFLDSIARKRIRVLIARGDYPTALAQYESFVDVSNAFLTNKARAALLTDKGTLHRRMANFRDARECFRGALRLQEDRYQALAGIAEVDKQCGRLHRSLGRYNDLLRAHDETIDPRSKKIYQLSTAFLYQLTHQFGSSLRVLSSLHDQYRYDRSINSQLGRLLILMGKPNDAKPYIKRSQRSECDDVSEELFALAMGTSLDYVKPIVGKALSAYLPEERGLVVCGRAFDAILRGSFNEAWDLTSSVTHHNHLHRDFGLVLGFHARKQMDSSLCYKAEQPLARIAKRGHRQLKSTVAAINREDFVDAIENEKQMLQLVA